MPHSIDADGVPILDGWLSLLVCETYSVMVAGDHEVLFGEVVHCERREGAPLLFHESALRMLPKLPPLPMTGEAAAPSADDDDLYDSLVRVLAPPIRPRQG